MMFETMIEGRGLKTQGKKIKGRCEVEEKEQEEDEEFRGVGSKSWSDELCVK